jgi:hypothetical protein
MPIILATQEAEIRRIEVQSQPRQIVHKNLSKKTKKSQKRAGGVTEGVDPEFKPQYHKKKKTEPQESIGLEGHGLFKYNCLCSCFLGYEKLVESYKVVLSVLDLLVAFYCHCYLLDFWI